MSKNRAVFAYTKTVGGNSVTVPTANGVVFGGFIMNGSGGGSTVTVKDGSTTLFSTSAGADAYITYNPPQPIACPDGIAVTCSGTGFYTVLHAI